MVVVVELTWRSKTSMHKANPPDAFAQNTVEQVHFMLLRTFGRSVQGADGLDWIWTAGAPTPEVVPASSTGINK